MGEFRIADVESKGGRWRRTLAEAIEAEWQERYKGKDPGPQVFKVEIYVWAENPVREYRAVLEPGDPGS